MGEYPLRGIHPLPHLYPSRYPKWVQMDPFWVPLVQKVGVKCTVLCTHYVHKCIHYGSKWTHLGVPLRVHLDPLMVYFRYIPWYTYTPLKGGYGGIPPYHGTLIPSILYPLRVLMWSKRGWIGYVPK